MTSKLKTLFFVYTCGSSLQTWPKRRHHSWISDLTQFSYSDLEGTAGDMAAIKTNVYRMNSILLWDEPDSMLICRNRKSLIYKQFYNHRKYRLWERGFLYEWLHNPVFNMKIKYKKDLNFQTLCEKLQIKMNS